MEPRRRVARIPRPKLLRGRLEAPAGLSPGATLLEATNDPVQARRVNAHRLAGLGDRDARPLADQREELLLAPAPGRAAPTAHGGRRAAPLGGRGAPATSRRSRRAIGRRGRRRRLAPACPRGGGGRRGRHVDAEALGHRFKLAVLRPCGLELLEALGDALLGVAEIVEDRHGTLLTSRGGVTLYQVVDAQGALT